jgi:hypothetical protein
VSAFLIGFNAIKNLFTLQENQKVSFSKKPTYHKESKLSSFYISFQVPEAVCRWTRTLDLEITRRAFYQQATAASHEEIPYFINYNVHTSIVRT